MNEKERDRLLRIYTRSGNERVNQPAHYHHYEATSYWMLDELFNAYEPNKDGTFVDIGCGKGRILFYVHHYFHLPVLGIEMNAQLYRQALSNAASYLSKKRKNKQPIRIEHTFAEQYEVEKNDRTFFLFNPFSLEIFARVVQNILHSLEKFPRTVDIILYYPAEEYIEFLRKETSFTLFKKVELQNLTAINERETFLIYRYQVK